MPEPVTEPVRTCVGCRTPATRRSLLRVVREPNGEVAADPAGRAPGRGAYVHPTHACIQEAVRRGAIARALRASLDRERAVRLQADLERIVERLRASTGSARPTDRMRPTGSTADREQADRGLEGNT